MNKIGSLLFLVAIALLGMPLEGTIPEPPGIFRESAHISLTDKISSQKHHTALVWSFIYLGAFSLLLLHPKQGKRAIVQQPFLLLLVGLAGFSAAWSPNHLAAMVDAAQMLGASMIVLVGATTYCRRVGDLVKHLSWTFGLNLIVNLLSVIFIAPETTHPDGRWAGVTGASNYLGSIAFCGAWASVSAMLSADTRLRWSHFVFLLISLATLFGSGSVTSLLCTFVVIVGLIYSAPTRSLAFALTKRFLIYIGLFALIGILVFVDLMLLPEYVGRESHLSGRTALWIAAINLLEHNLWIGYGYGVDTESLGVTHWATSFHNGYLETAVRLGLCGIALLAAMFVKFWMQIRSLNATEARPDVWFVAPIIVGILIYNLAESAFLGARSPTWLLTGLLVYVIALRISAYRNTPSGAGSGFRRPAQA
jgi:O-antigen ligase